MHTPDNDNNGNGGIMVPRVGAAMPDATRSTLSVALPPEGAATRAGGEHFHFIADAAPVMIWVSGAGGERIYVNTLWREFTGRPVEQEMGDRWSEGVHPDDRDRICEEYLRNTTTREPFTLTYRLRRADGSYREVHDRGLPRFSPSGEFEGYFGFCNDLNERPTPGEANLLLSAVIESSNDAMICCDLEQRVLSWNKGAEEIYGYTAAEVAGKNVDTFMIPPERREEAQHLFENYILRGESISNFETVQMRKGGARIHVELHVHPVKNPAGKMIAFGVTARDITRQKKEEAEKMRQLARMRVRRLLMQDIIASLPGVVWEEWTVPDPAEHRVNFVNAYVETMLGYTPQEWLAQPNFWLAIVHPDDREQAASDIAAITAAAGMPGTCRFRWLARDGTVVWARTRAVAICDEDGAPIGVRCVTIDVDPEEARRRLSAVVDSANDAIISYDETRTVLSWNKKAEEMFGYGAEEMIGKDVDVLIPEDLFGEPGDFLAIVRRGVEIRHFETIRRHKDGKEIPVSLNVSPIKNTAGDFLAALVTFRSLAALKEAEAEKALLHNRLQAKRQHLQDVVSTVPGMVWEIWNVSSATDAPQRADFVNTYVETMLGYTVQEWSSVPEFWLAAVHPDDRERAQADILTIMLAGGLPGTSQFRWIAKDGSVLWGETHAVGFCDDTGVPIGLRAVTIDVTARVQMEEALRQSEERYRLITRATSDAIYEHDLILGKVTYTDGFVAHFGYPYEHAVISVADALERIHPDDRARITASYRKAQDAGEMIWVAEYRFQRADGTYIAVADHGHFIRDDAGTPVKFVGALANISERKHIEEERQRLLVMEREARREVEQAHDRVMVLARAGMVLGSSLNYANTLASVARLIVTSLADWCIVELLQDDGTLQRVAIAHMNVQKIQTARRIEGRFPADLSAGCGVGNVLRTGKTEVYGTIPDELLRTVAPTDEALASLRALGLTSAMIVPLTARGRCLGTITFIAAESGRRYTGSDVEPAEELARRAANAVDNALLFRQAQDALHARDDALKRLAAHAGQQAGVAKLGQRALEGGTLPDLLQEAVNLLAAILETDRAILFVPAPGESAGWQVGAGYGMSSARLAAIALDGGAGTLAGTILASPEPVVIADILRERRFTCPEWLRGERIMSGAAIAIRGGDSAYGILSTFSIQRRGFATYDLFFLQAVANVLATAMDRKQAEDALVKSETLYRLVTRATNDAVWDWDLQANHMTWNEGISTMFGYTPEMVGQLPSWWEQLIHPENRQHVIASRTLIIEGGGANWSAGYKVLCANGSYASVADRGYVVRDGQGKAVRMIGAIADITEWKRAEEVLRQAHNELEQRVAQRTEELSQINRILMTEIVRRKQVEERLRKNTEELERAQFASWNIMEDLEREVTDRKQAEHSLRVLSRHLVGAQENERRRLARELHDGINQLLSSVKMRVQAAEEKLQGEKLQGQESRAGKDIEQAKILLNTCIQEIRDISKNLTPSVLEDLGLVTALRSICAEVKEQSSVAVTFRCRPFPVRLPAEIELTVYRIVQETLNNMVKHAQATRASVRIWLENGLIHVRVKDNGRGFDLQNARARKRRTSSAGFGLMSMQERATYIGGTLEILSTPGSGTELRLTIPLSAAHSHGRKTTHEKGKQGQDQDQDPPGG